ncbi:MAG TPA: hypothetical protein PLD30_12015 [Candidatus Competibacteraceae bacterium]|nr:hypothetical protein [Candidatus Competibacteraceae bacterium]
MMVKQQYTVSFVTPAFLGDANQNGAWRTPPFKALLRQWWRVVAAKDHDYSHERLRETEGRLFGNAWLDNEFQQSKLLLRLGEWRQGKMQKWAESEQKVPHPEVKFPVDAHLYLGYGPLTYSKVTHKAAFAAKVNAAIQAGESNTLRIAGTNETTDALARTLPLIHNLGTMGGRARNGWGSLELSGDSIAFQPLGQSNPLLLAISRPLPECLQYDWPHALGRDDRGLLMWTTRQNYDHWQDAMRELAKAKIAFRTALKFINPKGQMDRRHVLAYPVTNHPVNAWGSQARLANQLRFKVISHGNRLLGVAYHLPCGTPGELLRRLGTQQNNFQQQQLSVWRNVHIYLDTVMHRIA